MLTKFNRQKAIDKFPNLPLRHYDPKKDEYVFNYPKKIANYVLTLPSKSYKGHIKLMSTEPVSLTKGLGSDHLIFPGDENIAWLRRLNTHEIFQESLQYPVDNKVGKRFSGALQADIIQLLTFIKNLAWLVRTNGVLPYVHFADTEQNIIGNICQYGNLHISTKNKKADTDFKSIIAKCEFEFINEEGCTNKFSKSSKVKG